MAWEFRYEVDEAPCEICLGAILIESKREGSAEGSWGPWTPHNAWCSRGCVVVSDAEARVRRHIAKS